MTLSDLKDLTLQTLLFLIGCPLIAIALQRLIRFLRRPTTRHPYNRPVTKL